MPMATPELQREYQRKWLAKRRRDWIAAHGPCIDCGTWNDLQIDHADAAAKVSHNVWSWAQARREAELAKCVVRCRPCHVTKTTQAGEHAQGERHGSAKLTVAQVRAIRASTGTCRAVGAEFGVAAITISVIRRRVAWRFID